MEYPPLNERSYYYLADIRRWSKLIAVFGYMIIGILILFGVFFGFFYNNPEIQSAPGAVSGITLMFVYLVMALIYLFPVVFLHRFASNLGRSLRSGNETELTRSFQNLRSFFRYIGILTIIMIALGILLFIVGFFAAFFGVFMTM